jgi:hypothetical protein
MAPTDVRFQREADIGGRIVAIVSAALTQSGHWWLNLP